MVSYKSLLLGGNRIRPKDEDGGSWKSNSAVSTETSVWKRKRTSTPSVTFGDSSLLWGSLCIIPSILPVKMVMKQFGQNKNTRISSGAFLVVEVTGLEPVTLLPVGRYRNQLYNKRKPPRFPRVVSNHGGSYRARTCDPLLVRQMLSQLS